MPEYFPRAYKLALLVTVVSALCLFGAHAEPLRLDWDALGCAGEHNDSSPLLPSGTNVGQCGAAPSLGTWRIYTCTNVSFYWTDYDNAMCAATYVARDAHITGVCINNYLTNTSYAYVCDLSTPVDSSSEEHIRTSYPPFLGTTSQCSEPGKCESSFYTTYFSDNECKTPRSAVNNIDSAMKSDVCYNQPSTASSEYTTNFECQGNLFVKKSYTGDCSGTVFRTETTPTNHCRPSGVSAYAKVTCVDSSSLPDVPTPSNNAQKLGVSIIVILALIGTLFGL